MSLRLQRIEARAFAGQSGSAADPALREFLADLVAAYHLPLREDLLAAGIGHSYGEMAEQVLRGVATEDDPVDLLVVAYAMPDVIPGRSTATYLSSLCPGQPLAFAVCDQGLASPFTALSIAQSYLGSSAASRALVLVLEQSALHYEPPVPVRTPTGHAAVGLVLTAGTAGSAGTAAGLPQPPLAHSRAGWSSMWPSVWPEVGERDAAALVAAELDPQTTLVTGAELAELLSPPPGPCLVAPAGQPLTGLWQALSTLDSTTTVRVVVADYDRALRYLCLATLTGGSG